MPFAIKDEKTSDASRKFKERGLDISKTPKSMESRFESELKDLLGKMKKGEVFAILESPSIGNIKLIGNKGVGVLAADDIVVQIDKNDAKVIDGTNCRRVSRDELIFINRAKL